MGAASMNLNALGDVLCFYLCLAILLVWVVLRFLFGVDLFQPCQFRNECTIAAVEKYAKDNGQLPVTCLDYQKVDNRVCE